jgi:hypothetical protein
MVRSRKLAFSLTTDHSRCVPIPGLHIIPRHLTVTKQPFFRLLFFFSLSGTTCSCIAHFSTRHTVAHRPVNAAVALVPQGAHRSLSRRFRRHRIMARMILEHGPWTSCRYARWEVGHQTGRTCESRVVIFDQARDVLNEPSVSEGKAQDPFAYSWTIRRTI